MFTENVRLPIRLPTAADEAGSSIEGQGSIDCFDRAPPTERGVACTRVHPDVTADSRVGPVAIARDT